MYDGRLLSGVHDGAAVLDLRDRAGRRARRTYAGGWPRVTVAAGAVVGERRAHRQEGEQGEDRGHLEWWTEFIELINRVVLVIKEREGEPHIHS